MAFPTAQASYVVTAMNFAAAQRPALLEQGLHMDQVNMYIVSGDRKDAIQLSWDESIQDWRVTL